MTRTFDQPGFVNARSLEGLPTSSGEIRPGRLFRSAVPDGDVDSLLASLATEDIVTIIDLRSDDEIADRPSVLASQPGYRRAPLIDPRTVHDSDVDRSLMQNYLDIIDRNGHPIVHGVQAIAHAEEGGVLVHCAAGKDRTGILIALVLAVTGVPDEEIVADFAETQDRLVGYFAAELTAITDLAQREWLAPRQHSKPEIMVAMLDHVRSRHGGVRAYLDSHGFTDEDAERLTTRLTARHVGTSTPH